MCEIVMVSDNVCRNINDPYRYPGIEEDNCDDNHLRHSLDNYSGI